MKATVGEGGLGERVISRGRVRVGSFMHCLSMFDELGVDTDALLAGADLDRHRFAHPENVISFTAIGRLLGAAVTATGRPALGAEIGVRSRLSSLGPVGVMMQASPTVRLALQALTRHSPAHDGGSIIALDEGPPVAVLTYRIIVPGVPALDQIYAMVAGMGASYLRTLLGAAWRPREVLLPFARPAEVAPLRKVFDAPLRFDTDVTGLVFTAAELPTPLATADPFLHAMMLERLQQLEAMATAGLTERVRHLLGWLIYSDGWDARMVATHLGVSLRTLNRRLAEAGTTLGRLREETYRDAACQLLSSTNKPAGEIAALLQYSDASAFTRAFRRWQGVAPTQWRASRRGARTLAAA